MLLSPFLLFSRISFTVLYTKLPQGLFLFLCHAHDNACLQIQTLEEELALVTEEREEESGIRMGIVHQLEVRAGQPSSGGCPFARAMTENGCL